MKDASVIFKGLPLAATAIFAAMAWAAPAQAESCPWDMVYDRQAQDCVYYRPGNGSNSNTANGGAGIGVGIGQGGNSSATGGNATANGGAGGNGGIGRGGNASVGNLTNQQQQGQSQTAQGGNATGGSANNANNVSVNNSTRIRHSAASAADVRLNGYGPGNCFGDTNPSGSFGAALQTFGWGVSASSSKASNVCAIYAVGGERAAIAYLAAMDPNAHRALIAAGLAATPSRQVRPAAVEVQTRPTGRLVCPATHPVYVEGRGCRK